MQVGLFWSASARGRHRLYAALLMVPCALLIGGLVGEAIMRVLRGYSLKVAATITWIGGMLLYVWQFSCLARRREAG